MNVMLTKNNWIRFLHVSSRVVTSCSVTPVSTSTSTSASTSSDLSGYCVDLVVRLWSLAVIDHRRGLGLLGGGRDGSYLVELHTRIGDVIVAAGELDGEVLDGKVLDGKVLDGKVLDESLYELAMAVGMPPLVDSSEDFAGESTESNQVTLLRVMAMGHIASVLQCGVMALGACIGARDGAEKGDRLGEARDGKRQGSSGREVVDGLRRLRRVARRLRQGSSELSVCGDVVTLEALCGEVLEAVEGAKAGGGLPAGFFDVMIPYGMDSLDAGQRERLARVATALEEETALRRKMMLDRAVATLKTFSIRQEASNVRVLDALTEEARARMEVILEGRVAGVDEAWRMIKGEVVSLLVERGVGEEHGSVSNRIKTVQIGRVPDRGGRPEGVSRQAALMPEWKAREQAKKAGSGTGQHRGNKKQRQ